MVRLLQQIIDVNKKQWENAGKKPGSNLVTKKNLMLQAG